MRLLKFLVLLAIAAAVVIVLVFRGINARIQAAAEVRHETAALAVPAVSVIHPKRGDPVDEIILPGNIQAFIDAPIYARTSGYLKRWNSDIGARVKSGDLLAEIDTPEVDKQLDQARADLATSEANYRLAESTSLRWRELLKTESVSKQETDEKVGDFHARKAAVDSARANVRRLEDMQSFQKVYAPFDGVITARNTDVGQLVAAGSGGPAKELFHLAATDRLRVFVNVPQVYSRSAATGATADLTLAEFPGRRFHGRLARNSGSIDAASRTLLVEVDVANPGGLLLPGAYTEVHLKLPSRSGSLLLPVNALIFRADGLQAGVVRNGDRAELVPIRMGKDYGVEVQIVSGIAASDLVIVNPPDSLTSGMTVRVAAPSGGAAK